MRIGPLSVLPTRHARLSSFALGAACIVASSAARADVIEACTSAAASGQRLARAGKLHDARASFVACIRPECPAEVKAVCDGLLSTLDKNMPTLIVGARTEDGQDLVDVRVKVDDVLVLESLDGKAISVDPGPHVLRFDHGASPSVVRTVVMRETEKDRLLSVTFARPRAEPPSRPEPPSATRATPAIVYVLAGVGAVSLGGFAFLAAYGQSQFDRCNPGRCTQATVDSLGLERGLAFGALGVGVLSLGGAAGLWLLRTSGPTQGASVTVGLAPGGARLLVTF
jgi:hypothetical protein